MTPRHRAAAALLGTLVLTGVVAWRVDLSASAALLRQARPGPFLLAAALGPVQIALSGLRWQRVAQALGPAPPLRAAIPEYATGTFLNQVLPGGVGGDALRAWRHHRRWGASGADAALSAVLERAAGQATLLLVVTVGALAWPALHPASPRPGWLIPLLVGLLAVAAGVALSPAAAPGLGRLSAAARVSLRGLVWPLSALITATYVAGFALCAVALGLSPGAATLTAIPLILLAMALPISVGGWGLREAAAAAVLPPLGWPAEAAVATAALYGLSALLGASPGLFTLLRPEPT